MNKFQALSEMSNTLSTMSDFLNQECENDSDYIRVKDAAEMLNVSSARVKKMCADQVLCSVSTLKVLWVYKPDVIARIEYIKEHGKPTRSKSYK